MDVKHLKSFLAVAECGSVSEAARKLYIPQPALKAGRSSPWNWRVVIGLPMAVTWAVAERLIRTIQTDLSKVRPTYVESLSGHLQRWLEQGSVDISFLYDAESTPNLAFEPILLEQLELLCRPGDFPREIQSIPLRDVVKLPLMLPGRAHSVRRLIEETANRYGHSLNVVAEAESQLILRAALLSCGMFSVSGPSLLQDDVQAGNLRKLIITDPAITRSVVLAQPALRTRTRAHVAVAELALRLAQDLCREGIWRGTPLERST